MDMDICDKADICLKRFDKNIEESWKDLQFDKDFCDMSLASEGKLINVHKVIISASSPVLKNILQYSNHQNPFIYLTGVKYEDLKSIVTLIYQGKVIIAEDNLDFFLEVAENLEIKGFHRSSIQKYTGNNYGHIQKSTINEISQNIESSSNDSFLYSNLKNLPTKNEVAKIKSNSDYDVLLNEKSIEVSYEQILEDTSKMQNNEDSNHKLAEVKVKDYIIDNLSTTAVDYSYIENIKDFPLNNEEMGLKTYFDTVEIKANIIEKKNIDTKQNVKKSKKYLVNSEVEFCSCKICDKKYMDKCEFKDHVKLIHHGIYACHLCDFESSKFFLHKHHIEQFHKGVRYECNQCDHKTTNKGNLGTHIKVIHEGLKKYPCDICDYKATAANLKRHKAHKHQTEEHLKCDQCDFDTRTNQQLSRHVRVNHKSIKEVCDECNKIFTRKDHLRVHMDSIHNNIRFQCDHCEHQTTRKDELSRHIKRIHTIHSLKN